jgi:hypothetical protein
MYSQATSSCAIFPTSRISIGCPACQNFVISGKKPSSDCADFNPSERVDLRYLRLARFGYSQGSSSRRSPSLSATQCQEARRFGYVASIELPITNQSDIVSRVRVTTSDHLSPPITNHQSPITNHAASPIPPSLLTAALGLVVPLQDLFLVFSPGVWRLALRTPSSSSKAGLRSSLKP